jgi:NACalpha-BTF3-like transcription factor
MKTNFSKSIIALVMMYAVCSRDEAISYLEAEEGDPIDAVLSYRGDHWVPEQTTSNAGWQQ